MADGSPTTEPNDDDRLRQLAIEVAFEGADPKQVADSAGVPLEKLREQARAVEKEWPIEARYRIARSVLQGSRRRRVAERNRLPDRVVGSWISSFLGERKRPVVVRNLANRRLRVRSAHGLRQDDLHLGPLEERTVDVPERFALDEWVARGVVERAPPKRNGGFRYEILLGGLVWVVIGGGVGLYYLLKAHSLREHYITYAGGVAVLVIAIIAARKYWKERDSFLSQFLSLLLVLAVGSATPAFALLGLPAHKAVFEFDPGNAILHLVTVVILSLLPALLFFLFDRQTLAALRRRLHIDLLRLDPRARTLGEVDALYGRELDDALGTRGDADEAQLRRGTRWPILIATIVISIGWLRTLDPTEGLLTPQQTPFAFGFMGAYVFALGSTLRRHVRRDLTPKAYSSIVARIVVVFILTAVLEKADPPTTLLVSFAAGVFPDAALRYLLEVGGKGIHYFSEERRHPLSKLTGIDLYDRARLKDEGVANVHGLAEHNLVDLMIRTRVPAARLVGWVDQAILYVHTEAARSSADDTSLLDHLRTCGIETASGLRYARRHFSSANGSDPEKDEQFLSRASGGDSTLLRIVMADIDDDEWLPYIEHWRASDRMRGATLESPDQLFEHDPAA